MYDAIRYPGAWVLALAAMLASGPGVCAADGTGETPSPSTALEHAVVAATPSADAALTDDSRVFTLLDYFAAGEREIDRFLTEPAANSGAVAPSDLDSLLSRIRRACVRVDVRFDIVDDRYQSITGSGVLLEQGRLLLTAGHVVDDLRGEYEISVIISNGERRRARMLQFEYDRYGGSDRDWAILEVEGPPVKSIPWLPIGAPRTGETAFVLGYPNEIGMDAVGDMTFAGQMDNYLRPLATIGLIENAGPLVMAPHVGSVPTSGMSGAPVFDARGRLIGIFVSIAQRVSREGVNYRYQAASVQHLRARLVSLRSSLRPSSPPGSGTLVSTP